MTIPDSQGQVSSNKMILWDGYTISLGDILARHYVHMQELLMPIIITGNDRPGIRMYMHPVTIESSQHRILLITY